MKSLASWLSIMFLGIFWLFRIAITLSAQFGSDFGGFVILNNTFEIVMLFVTLVCFALIAKRIILGPIIYLIGYGWYYASYIFGTFIPALTSGGTADSSVMLNSAVMILQIILGLATLLIMAYEKTKLKHFSDNKTDWYFNNDKYDRKFDERADKNQYKTL